MRLIDADELRPDVRTKDGTLCCSKSRIANAPTVEYPFYAEAYQTGYEEGKNERPKGKWLKSSNMSKRSYQRLCSNCKHIVYFCGDGNYPNCPYCLADMRGEENGTDL